MQRGDLYRVRRPPNDPRPSRVFVIVSRPRFLEARAETAVCVPVYLNYDAISTQVPVGPEEGLKHESAAHCDQLTSLFRSRLTDYVGTLRAEKLAAVERAIIHALALEHASLRFTQDVRRAGL